MESILYSNEALKRKLRSALGRFRDSNCPLRNDRSCFYILLQKWMRDFCLNMEDDHDDDDEDDDDEVDGNEGDNDLSFVDLITISRSGKLLQSEHDRTKFKIEDEGLDGSIRMKDISRLYACLEDIYLDAGDDEDDGFYGNGTNAFCSSASACRHGNDDAGLGWISCTDQFKFFRIVDNYYYHQFHPSVDHSIYKISGITRSCTLCCDSLVVSKFLLQHSDDNDATRTLQAVNVDTTPSCSRSLESNSSSTASGGVQTFVPGGDALALPDLLPPQIPPRNNVMMRKFQDKSLGDEALNKHSSLRSFQAFGFGASKKDLSTSSSTNPPGQFSTLSSLPSRGSHINVNVTPTTSESDTPEIHKYQKRFNSDVLCAALWGVNLLIGTDSGLVLLDRSGQGKVYQLISRRKFVQMEVLEGQNILVTISGKKNKLRVYYLSWLKTKIFKTEGSDKKNGWANVGDLENCVHFKIVKYERIKFLVIALKESIEIYAWAPKPYHKFMAFKSFSNLVNKPILVDLTIEEGQRLKVIYGSTFGFHGIDLDTSQVFDVYIPSHSQGPITPNAIVILPNSDGMQLLLCYDNEGVYVDTNGRVTKNVVLQWGESPTSVAFISTGQIMGWGHKAIEIRSSQTGHLDGVFMHRKAQKLKFLCERNDKVFFSSMRSTGSACQIYFMTLNKPGLNNW